MTFGEFSVGNPSNIFVGGGKSTSGKTSNEIWSFAPLANTWSFFANMPAALSFATAQMVDSNLYVIGGIDSSNRTSSKIYVLNILNKTWSIYPDTLRKARAKCVSLVRNARIYVFGGEAASGVLSDAVDEIKIKSNKCVAKANIGSSIYPYGCFLYKGEMYFIGGDEIKAIRVLKFALPY